MQEHEYRVISRRPNDNVQARRVKVFQRQHNLQAHLAWLNENAHQVIAVERRPVGDWQPIP